MLARAIEICWIGNEDLIKAVVSQAPKGSAPFAVQSVDCFVSSLQPFPKSLLGRRAVIGRRVRFVVQLPSPDSGVLSVPASEFGDYSLAQSQIGGGGKRVVATRSVLASSAVGADKKSLRVFLTHPGGWTGGRCAQHHPQVMARGQF